MYIYIFIYIQVFIHEVTHLFIQSIASKVCFDLNLQSQRLGSPFQWIEAKQFETTRFMCQSSDWKNWHSKCNTQYWYMYKYIHIYTCIHIYIHIYIHTYVYRYIHMYIEIYISLYREIFERIYTYTHIHIYIYIDIYK